MPNPCGTIWSMTFETLWAPWRLGYVQGREKGAPLELVEPETWRPGADHSCFLCRAAAVAPAHHRALGVVGTTPHSVVVINPNFKCAFVLDAKLLN